MFRDRSFGYTKCAVCVCVSVMKDDVLKRRTAYVRDYDCGGSDRAGVAFHGFRLYREILDPGRRRRRPPMTTTATATTAVSVGRGDDSSGFQNRERREKASHLVTHLVCRCVSVFVCWLCLPGASL